jgi:Trypsin
MATIKTTWSLLPRQFKLLSALLVATFLATSGVTPAQASFGGTLLSDNSFSVGYTFTQAGVDQICSGVLVSPIIIASAAHCTVDAKGNKSSNYIFAAPGTALDAPLNPAVRRPQVVKIFSSTGDIVFLQLDIPLATKGMIRVATSAEVTALTTNSEVMGYGFGKVPETQMLYSPLVRRYPLMWNADHDESNTVLTTSKTATACVGDSGGAITARLPSGEEVLVAVMKGAASVVDGCATQVNGLYTMMVTAVHPYLDLITEILATPVTVPSPSASPVPKKTKILCMKGKVKKYVYAINPKCPKGYKKV